MTRPTLHQLAKARWDLDALAYFDEEMFHLFAAMLDKANWARVEIEEAKNQAGHKRSSEVAPVGVGGGSSVEAQFADHSTPTRMYRTDEMVRETQKTRRRWVSQLITQSLGMYNESRQLGYPHRSVPEGWRVG